MLSSTPLISVVVPVYMVEDYLVRCIESIRSQTYRNLELILVDDGSKDNCPAICERYAKKDNRIKAIHKDNGGVSDARNTGINAASGEYIMFVDSDDAIDADMLELLFSSLSETNSDISACGIRNVKKLRSDHGTHRELYNNQLRLISPEQAITDMLYQKIVNGSVCKLFKSSLLDGLRFSKDISIAEDLDFNFEVFLKAKLIAVNSLVKYSYILRPASATQNNFSKKRMDGLKVASKIYKSLQARDSGIRKAAANRLFMEAIFILMQIKPEQFPDEYNECVRIVKKYRYMVLTDNASRFKIRYIAAASLINSRLITASFSLKKRINRYA